MTYRQGDRVRLIAFHRTQDHRGVIVSLNVADVLEVAGYVTGSPDVRCRFLGRPNRTVLVPAMKLTRCAERVETAGAGQVGETGDQQPTQGE